MNLHVSPIKSLKGKIKATSSKSYSIRAFMIAACGGRSVIVDPSDCDDAVVSMRVARALGCRITKQSRGRWSVVAPTSVKKSSKSSKATIDVGESGTVLRFVLPLLSLREQKFIVTGRGTLRGRPNLFLNQTLRSMGIDIRGEGPKESIPITINGGKLNAGEISIDGTLSSQFISALLISCPQLKETTRLTLTGKRLVSLDYITMTRKVLAQAGITIKSNDVRHYVISGGQRFQGLKNFVVPSDYGLAAFLMAAAALVPSDVTLLGNWDTDLIQADGHIIPLLRKMGVRFQISPTAIRIQGPFALKGGDFSLKDCPDLVPIMTTLALFAHGRTRIYGIAHARAKESDRISDLREELLKIGADIREKKDELVIFPRPNYKLDVRFNPHSDHRLAMSFSILGLKLGAIVEDIECSAKSYPQFVNDLKKLRVPIKTS